MPLVRTMRRLHNTAGLTATYGALQERAVKDVVHKDAIV